MGGQKCPRCEKGILRKTSRGTYRCKHCGFTKHPSPNRHSWGAVLFPEEKKEEKEKIPSVLSKKEEKEDRRAIPKGKGYHSQEYEGRKFIYDEQLRLRNKALSIERILKKLRRNKYNTLKEIVIEGELWDIESGQLVREKEKPKKEEKKEKEEFTPDRIIEEILEEQSG